MDYELVARNFAKGFITSLLRDHFLAIKKKDEWGITANYIFLRTKGPICTLCRQTFGMREEEFDKFIKKAFKQMEKTKKYYKPIPASGSGTVSGGTD